MDLIIIYGQDVFLHTVTLTKGFERSISFGVMGGLFTFTRSSQEVLTSYDGVKIWFYFSIFTVSVALHFYHVSYCVNSQH